MIMMMIMIMHSKHKIHRSVTKRLTSSRIVQVQKIVKQKPSIIQGSTNPLSKLMEQTKDPPVGKYKHFFIVSKVTK